MVSPAILAVMHHDTNIKKLEVSLYRLDRAVLRCLEGKRVAKVFRYVDDYIVFLEHSGVRRERGDDWRDAACGQQVRATRGGGNRPRRDPQQWVHFPRTSAEKAAVKEGFLRHSGIPGVIGCVDGSLLAIIAPKGDNKAAYMCRKGFYGLNSVFVSIVMFV
ncbi:hypothetical protein HPB49_022823 [Dermacentor silvarum]|uniref:Uncharacterized protein n=1 Tax=Dermacentor silvarum TaxID=543639 RepID=A0ACB8CHT8_DERSI|nr:hypothetical protein HPB49_022823 [Dermacentor silvarum]